MSSRLAHDRIDIVNLEAIRQEEGRQFLFSMEIAAPPRTNIEQLKSDLAALGEPAFDVRLRPFSELQEEFRPLRAFLR